MLHGKRPEAAKRKALGTGISPRALGRAATARTDLGTWRVRTGTSWNGDNEQRRAAAERRRASDSMVGAYCRIGCRLAGAEGCSSSPGQQGRSVSWLLLVHHVGVSSIISLSVVTAGQDKGEQRVSTGSRQSISACCTCGNYKGVLESSAAMNAADETYAGTCVKQECKDTDSTLHDQILIRGWNGGCSCSQGTTCWLPELGGSSWTLKKASGFSSNKLQAREASAWMGCRQHRGYGLAVLFQAVASRQDQRAGGRRV